jgi:hypothetical protein
VNEKLYDPTGFTRINLQDPGKNELPVTWRRSPRTFTSPEPGKVEILEQGTVTTVPYDSANFCHRFIAGQKKVS